jgi:hypothetical protein
LETKAARTALAWAEHAAREADIPALTAEVESASLVMKTPAAHLIARGEERPTVTNTAPHVLEINEIVHPTSPSARRRRCECDARSPCEKLWLN